MNRSIAYAALLGCLGLACGPAEGRPVDTTTAVAGSTRVGFLTTSSDGGPTIYMVSLTFEAVPAVGLNPVRLTVHATGDWSTFAPVDDAQLSLDPEMPTMGHGSPGSVAPVWFAPGQYRGELSFSMPGDWETTITVSRTDLGRLGTVTFSTSF